MHIGLCAKGAEFSADIAHAGGERAPGRSQLLAMCLMSVDFSVEPISAFSLRGAGLSPSKAAYTHLLTQRKYRLLTF